MRLNEFEKNRNHEFQNLIDWLIDWKVVYTVSGIFQPLNGGDY